MNLEYGCATLNLVPIPTHLEAMSDPYCLLLGHQEKSMCFIQEGKHNIPFSFYSTDYANLYHRSDGTIRVWDIRRAAACLRLLDQHNGDASPLADTNVAHGGGVNGFAFTGNGHYLVSLGLDEKIRLWDTFTLNNTLVNYGSLWRNQFRFYLQASISDTNVWPPLLYVPSDDHQVLVYELHSGILLRRLRGAYGRVTCTEYRPGYQELYVGSNDSEVLVWEPINENDQEPIDNSMGTFQDTWSESEDEEQ